VLGGALGAGKAALSVVGALLIIVILTVYSWPHFRRSRQRPCGWFRLASRAARVLGNEVFIRVGGFVLGNLLTSFVAGLGTFIWMAAFGLRTDPSRPAGAFAD